MTTDTKTKRTNAKGAQNKCRKPYAHTKKVFNPLLDEKAPFNDQATIKQVELSFTRAGKVYKSLHL